MIRGLFIFLVLVFNGSAWAADATWDTTFGTPGAVYSNSNKTIVGAGMRVMFAVDPVNKKWWVRAPYYGLWSGATGSANANIASVTGRDISALGNVNVAIGVYVANSGSIKLHAGSTIQGPIPSGYSTWESVAGATQFSASRKGTNVTLSDGNLVATTSTSGTNFAVTDTKVLLGTSGKVVFELELPASGGSLTSEIQSALVADAWSATEFGSFTTSTDFFSNNGGSSSVGWCYNYPTNACDGAGSTNRHMDNISSSQFQKFHKLTRSTRAMTGTEKLYWEVTLVTSGSGTVGVVDGTPGPIDTADTQRAYVGGDTHGDGYKLESNSFYANASAQSSSPAGVSTNANVNGRVFAVAFDVANHRLWIGHAGSGSFVWYGDVGGTPNPATNSWGLTAVNWTGGPYYPAVSVYGDASTSAKWTINGGATAFTYSIPSGFTQLDTVSAGAYYIFGANDNFPPSINREDRCQWAA